MIVALWNEAHPYVGEESYIMDFAYLASSHKMKMVEISPFLTCTGPALFKWTNDKCSSLTLHDVLNWFQQRASDEWSSGVSNPDSAASKHGTVVGEQLG